MEQNEQDSKDNDITDSCPRNVRIWTNLYYNITNLSTTAIAIYYYYSAWKLILIYHPTTAENVKHLLNVYFDKNASS